MSRRVPPLIPVAIVAKASGWETEFTRDLLRRGDVLQKDGRLWKVRRRLLQERFDDVYRDVCDYYALDDA